MELIQRKASGCLALGGTEKDVSGLALAIMRSYLAVSILPRHDIFGVRMLRLPLRKPDEPLVIGPALKVGGDSDLSGVQSDQSNDFPLCVLIALDVSSRCPEARMSGQLLDVSEASADLADLPGGTGNEGSATGV